MRRIALSVLCLFVLIALVSTANAGIFSHRHSEASACCAPAAPVKVCAPDQVKPCAPACEPCKTKCHLFHHKECAPARCVAPKPCAPVAPCCPAPAKAPAVCAPVACACEPVSEHHRCRLFGRHCCR